MLPLLQTLKESLKSLKRHFLKNSSEEQAYGYLRQFIGGMDPETWILVCNWKLSVLVNITFSTLPGLSHCPIAHCMLVLFLLCSLRTSSFEPFCLVMILHGGWFHLTTVIGAWSAS